MVPSEEPIQLCIQKQLKLGLLELELQPIAVSSGIEQCQNYIETDRSKTESIEFEEDSDESFEHEELAKRDILVKGLAPDFIGISSSTNFASEIITSERWRSTFPEREAESYYRDRK